MPKWKFQKTSGDQQVDSSLVISLVDWLIRFVHSCIPNLKFDRFSLQFNGFYFTINVTTDLLGSWLKAPRRGSGNGLELWFGAVHKLCRLQQEGVKNWQFYLEKRWLRGGEGVKNCWNSHQSNQSIFLFLHFLIRKVSK